jgi:hypothetical protein
MAKLTAPIVSEVCDAGRWRLTIDFGEGDLSRQAARLTADFLRGFFESSVRRSLSQSSAPDRGE